MKKHLLGSDWSYKNEEARVANVLFLSTSERSNSARDL